MTHEIECLNHECEMCWQDRHPLRFVIMFNLRVDPDLALDHQVDLVMEIKNLVALELHHRATSQHLLESLFGFLVQLIEWGVRSAKDIKQHVPPLMVHMYIRLVLQ